MNIKDITSENYELFRYVFWLDWSNKVKYIDLLREALLQAILWGYSLLKTQKLYLSL